MATHAPEQAFLVGTLAAMLNRGRLLVWGNPAQVITETTVSGTFGVHVKITDIDVKRGIKSCTALMD